MLVKKNNKNNNKYVGELKYSYSLCVMGRLKPKNAAGNSSQEQQQ